MTVRNWIFRYFWPEPPNSVSEESKKAMRADLDAKGLWSPDLGDANRQKVDVWVRHRDNKVRAENRVWMSIHAKTFAVRWTVLSVSLWFCGWLFSGNVWLEVPLVLCGYTSGIIAALLWWFHFRGTEITK
jgi:hypothetical protein